MNKYHAIRICPNCSKCITHTSTVSQAHVDRGIINAIKNNRTCLSCARSGDNNPSKMEHVKKLRSEFLKNNNPSRGKPAWNRGQTRDQNTKRKISDTIRNSGGRCKERNPNFGKFKEHSINDSYISYSRRVRVLTERNIHQLPNYDPNLRGRVGIPGAYQVDHIKPILECWLDNIPADLAANVSNLQFIPWEDNLARRKWKSKIK